MKAHILSSLFIALLLSPFTAIAQEEPMKAFDILMDGTWINVGTQLGGHEGKTEFDFEYGLDGKIVKVRTYNTDPVTMKFGLRNEGIRAWDNTEGQMNFYEFDKTGGTTIGTVTIAENDFLYDYDYQGMRLRDSWQWIDDNTYLLTIGVWEEGTWKQKFHEARFVREG